MKVHATPQQVEKIKKMRPDLSIKTLPSGNNEYMVEGVSDEQFIDFLHAKGMDLEQHESTAAIKELTITDQKVTSAQTMSAQSIPGPIEQKDSAPENSAPVKPEPEKITMQAVNENPNLAFNMLVTAIAQTLIKPIQDKLNDIAKRLSDLEKKYEFNKTQVEAAHNNLFLEVNTLKDTLTTFVGEQETRNQNVVTSAQNNVDEHKKISENIAKITKYLRDAPLLS